MTAPTRTSAYDQYADEYAAYVATREQDDLVGDPFGILTPLLAQLGDVTGQDVLDAGCGEGYLSRILAARGARVTGVDLSPRLVELAGQKASPGPIEYRVGDLSVPHPELEGHFKAVASFFVLNDVEDHRGFAETLARSLRPGGRAVLGFNNPYDYVMRKGHGSAYFTTGGAHPCGLSSVGVPRKETAWRSGARVIHAGTSVASRALSTPITGRTSPRSIWSRSPPTSRCSSSSRGRASPEAEGGSSGSSRRSTRCASALCQAMPPWAHPDRLPC